MTKTVLAIALTLGPHSAVSQTSTDNAFDVASVKLVDKPGQSPSDFRVTAGRLTATGLTLDLLIREAFNVKPYQLPNDPSWFHTQEFNITATAKGNPNRQTMMAMLQTLLVERFKLQYHWETKEGTVYTLLVTKKAPTLKEVSSEDQPYIRIFRYDPPERPSVSYALVGHNTSISALVERLATQLGVPVTDNTALQGTFDFKVEYSNDPAGPESAPPLPAAIQETLGLKLQPGKGSVEKFVIDHVELPSNN